MPSGIYVDGEDKTRCWWCSGHDDYQEYHDTEWGCPVADDRLLFEKICLEGFQSGLSWLTILRKREGFRAAFCDFNIQEIAKFDGGQIKRLMNNSAIIRNRHKIEATINNAKRAIEMGKEFGSLGAFFWQYEPKMRRAALKNKEDACFHTTSGESTDMAKTLKKRGWKFVGPTTAYAFMQAMGMVNDHIADCHCHERIEQLRRDFQRP